MSFLVHSWSLGSIPMVANLMAEDGAVLISMSMPHSAEEVNPRAGIESRDFYTWCQDRWSGAPVWGSDFICMPWLLSGGQRPSISWPKSTSSKTWYLLPCYYSDDQELTNSFGFSCRKYIDWLKCYLQIMKILSSFPHGWFILLNQDDQYRLPWAITYSLRLTRYSSWGDSYHLEVYEMIFRRMATFLEAASIALFAAKEIADLKIWVAARTGAWLHGIKPVILCLVRNSWQDESRSIALQSENQSQILESLDLNLQNARLRIRRRQIFQAKNFLLGIVDCMKASPDQGMNSPKCLRPNVAAIIALRSKLTSLWRVWTMQ